MTVLSPPTAEQAAAAPATVTLVDPTGGRLGGAAFRRAVASTELAGLRIGIVENGKWNAGHLLEAIRARLVSEHGMATGPTVAKVHYNRDLTDDERLLLSQGCDVALAAIGDCGSCTSYTVRDMVDLERMGIPTIAVVTGPFEGLARNYADVLGLADARVHAIEHPLYGIDDDALAARVAAAITPATELYRAGAA